MVFHSLTKAAALLALLTAAACAPKPAVEEAPASVPPEYQAVQDGEFLIPAVEPLHLFGTNSRTEVEFAGDEKPGTVVVDVNARRLYYVLEGNRAIRYAIAVGREGLSFKGTGYVGRKAEWPSWQPTANMIKTRPDMYAEYAAGLPGGLENPLGARAMYLYRNGRDTMFRIHGTIDNASIGRATSAGCIRLFNQDAIDLFNRVETGDKVKVRTLEESLAAEGPFMDDAYGRAVPDTEENRAQVEIDKQKIIEEEAAKVEAERLAAEAAEKQAAKDEKRRLRICRNRGIAEADCPTLDVLTGKAEEVAVAG
ncbi:L,D-transpeptidase [Gemmobacter straminiformis]|uniref:L,D-transpeptidase n=1 Tax=Paragemmobacter straminiformis TaxID=2045119 RepID=A0A842IA76_9RHOB|nr:L,D-transpeptidase [Gemmobacter straminiformis]